MRKTAGLSAPLILSGGKRQRRDQSRRIVAPGDWVVRMVRDAVHATLRLPSDFVLPTLRVSGSAGWSWGVLCVVTLLVSCTKQPPPLPTATIRVSTNGLPTRTAESSIAAPLESSISQLSIVTRLHTTITYDAVTTQVWTTPKTDADLARQKIDGQVGQAMRDLPENVMHPYTADSSTRTVVLRGTMRSTTRRPRELFESARHALETLPGVRQITACGAPEDVTRVTVDAQKLAAFHLDPDQIVSGLRAMTGLTKPAALEDLATIRIGPVRLNDVATISTGPETDACRANRTGAVVSLRLELAADADVEKVKAAASGVEWFTALTVVQFSAPRGESDSIDTALRGVATVTDVVLEQQATAGDRVSVTALIMAPGKLKGQLVHDLERAVESTPGRQLTWVAPGNGSVVTVMGDDRETLREVVKQLRGVLREPWVLWLGEDDVMVPEQQITIDRARAADLGVSAPQISQAIELAMPAGMRIGSGHPVFLTVQPAGEHFDAVRVGAQGVPLSSVATQRYQSSPAVLHREQRRPAMLLFVGSELGQKDLRQHLEATAKLPAGVTLEVQPWLGSR